MEKKSEVVSDELHFKFVGSGDEVIDQLPRKGEYVSHGETIVIMLK